MPTHKYTQEEKQTLVSLQMDKLKSGDITPQFAYKQLIDDGSEIKKFKDYHSRYVAGELTESEIELYNGDWLLALKEKDRKKTLDFIDGDGFKLRRDELALMNNRPLTDVGNSERLIDQFSRQLRYCHQMKSWYIWNYSEGRWKGDANGYINRIAKDVVRRIFVEASRAPNKPHAQRMSSWAYQCECRSHMEGMIEIAKSSKSVVIDPGEFDKNDYQFNLRNGTLNLGTLELQPHNRDNTISKLAEYEYNKNATCPMFTKYLQRIFRSNPNKDEIIKFLQRAVGYSLTGSTQEQCLFLLYGSGANGKTVFLDVMLEVLGEYGTTTQSRTFTTERGQINNDIAALVGRRFVCASENSSDSKLDEALIKQLTGGESISARFLHKEFFVFKPKFKLWWGFNHPPAISDMTNSIWRRIKIIPFTEILPESEWDKKLSLKIIANELPGVLNWAIEGLKEYNKIGLQQPEVITAATKNYKNDQDVLRDFFVSTYLETDSESDEVKASDLYAAYKMWWLNIESSKPMSSTKFGRLIRDRGIHKVEKNTGNYYTHIISKNKI